MPKPKQIFRSAQAWVAFFRGDGSHPGGKSLFSFWGMGRVMVCLFLFAQVSALWPETSEDEKPTEYEVKAAFLFNFTRFVEWPAGAKDSLFTVGILGGDPFGEALDRIFQAGREGLPPIQILRSRDLSRLVGCQMLFIAESDRHRLGLLLEQLRGRPILTVSDFPGFVDSGGMIELVLMSNRVRFMINRKAAEAAGLRISSKLLSLAVKTFE